MANIHLKMSSIKCDGENHTANASKKSKINKNIECMLHLKNFMRDHKFKAKCFSIIQDGVKNYDEGIK